MNSSAMLPILALCAVVGAVVYVTAKYAIRGASRRCPWVLQRLVRLAEPVFLGLLALTGAGLLATTVRWALQGSVQLRETVYGILFGTCLLLIGTAGLYGGTLPDRNRQFLARAYAGSAACRLLLTVAAICCLLYFGLTFVDGLLSLW